MSDLLPRKDRIRWILESSAKLTEGGAEPVSGIVLPTGAFFPDSFERSADGVRVLLRRIVKLAGLTDFKIKSQLVVPEEDVLSGGGCSTGACGVEGSSDIPPSRVTKRTKGWTVNVMASEIGNPTVLTTVLVRGVSHVFMRELDLFGGFEPHEREHATDLCGVLLGFGALLCNGSYIYKKG